MIHQTARSNRGLPARGVTVTLTGPQAEEVLHLLRCIDANVWPTNRTSLRTTRSRTKKQVADLRAALERLESEVQEYRDERSRRWHHAHGIEEVPLVYLPAPTGEEEG